MNEWRLDGCSIDLTTEQFKTRMLQQKDKLGLMLGKMEIGQIFWTTSSLK